MTGFIAGDDVKRMTPHGILVPGEIYRVLETNGAYLCFTIDGCTVNALASGFELVPPTVPEGHHNFGWTAALKDKPIDAQRYWLCCGDTSPEHAKIHPTCETYPQFYGSKEEHKAMQIKEPEETNYGHAVFDAYGVQDIGEDTAKGKDETSFSDEIKHAEVINQYQRNTFVLRNGKGNLHLELSEQAGERQQFLTSAIAFLEALKGA